MNQPPPNLRPERESPASAQTETDNPSIMNGAVWEDQGTLDWVLRLSNAVSSLPGGTSVQVDPRVKGTQPQLRLLVIIEPREKFNLKQGAPIGVPRGIQLWEPGNPLKGKITNVVTTPISISKRVTVVTVYSVNNFDIPWIQSLFKPLPQSCAGNKRITLNVPERQADSRESAEQDNLDETNLGELSPSEKEALMEILKEYSDVVTVNPKAVAACRGPSVRLELKNHSSAPCVAHKRHYTYEQRNMVQAEIEKLHKSRAVVPSTNQYAFCCYTARKKDGTVRVVQDFHGLNSLFKAQRRGLWDLLTIYDEINY